MNLADDFRQTARRQPAHPAVLGPGPDDRLSYRELDEAVRAAGECLWRAGVRPGDCVGLHVPSGIGYIVCTYAAWRSGASWSSAGNSSRACRDPAGTNAIGTSVRCLPSHLRPARQTAQSSS